MKTISSFSKLAIVSIVSLGLGAIAAYAIPVLATSFGNDVDVTGELTVGGNVGIGTTNPTQKFEVNGITILKGVNDNTLGQLSILTTGIAGHDAQITFGTAANGRGIYVDDNDTNKLKFYTGYGKGVAGREVTFDNEGNVGIGTTNPTQKFEVNGALKIAPTGAPASPSKGTIYFNATSNHFFGFNGTVWKQLDNN